MSTGEKEKRVSLTFKEGEFSAEHRRLFRYLAGVFSFDNTRGNLMEEAILLLAKEKLGDVSANEIFNRISNNIESERKSATLDREPK